MRPCTLPHLEELQELVQDGWLPLGGQGHQEGRLGPVMATTRCSHIDIPFKSFTASATKQDLRAILEGISLAWRFSGEKAMPASTSFDKLAGEVGWEFLMRFVALESER